MPDRAELGKRIKSIRDSRHLTLKTIESSAGISATHISEIERGKTSPTLGALIRLARALGKDPAYFLEEEELGDVSLVTLENRLRESLPGGAGTMERLTTCIPGGRIQAISLTLAPGKSHRRQPHTHFGNEAAFILAGRVRFFHRDETIEVEEGDAIHYNAGEPHGYENASKREAATMIWISTVRDFD